VHLVTSVNGLLQKLSAAEASLRSDARVFATGLPAVDGLTAAGGFAAGAVHEVLGVTDVTPWLFPAVVARSAARSGWVAWCDAARQLYPPAVAALGLPLDRLLMIRPADMTEAFWAVAECLGCAGVAACVAPFGRLSRTQVRKLQLAAERGGGVGVVVRPAAAVGWPYAAATRWRVRPVPGTKSVQRCHVELVHGHGGRVGEGVLLEACRETHLVRAVNAVADRPVGAEATTATA
jgi:protein ImuA